MAAHICQRSCRQLEGDVRSTFGLTLGPVWPMQQSHARGRDTSRRQECGSSIGRVHPGLCRSFGLKAMLPAEVQRWPKYGLCLSGLWSSVATSSATSRRWRSAQRMAVVEPCLAVLHSSYLHDIPPPAGGVDCRSAYGFYSASGPPCDSRTPASMLSAGSEVQPNMWSLVGQLLALDVTASCQRQRSQQAAVV